MIFANSNNDFRKFKNYLIPEASRASAATAPTSGTLTEGQKKIREVCRAHPKPQTLDSRAPKWPVARALFSRSSANRGARASTAHGASACLLCLVGYPLENDRRSRHEWCCGALRGEVEVPLPRARGVIVMNLSWISHQT